MHVRQSGESHHQCFHGPGQASQRARQYKSQQFVAINLIAQRDGSGFVFANHLQHLSKRRAHDARDKDKAQHKNGYHQVVEVDVRFQRNHAKQLATRHTLKAILAASKRCLQTDKVNHLRNGQRDHRKVNTLPADRHDAHQQTDQASRHGSGEQGQLRRPVLGLDKPAGYVSSGAKKRGVPKRQQTGKTEQQVERASKQCKAQQLHHKHRIKPEEWRSQRQGQ